MEHEGASTEKIRLPNPFNGCGTARDASDHIPETRAARLTREESSEFVRRIITARAARRKFFDEQLFADPAWDMLLELYALECEGRRISVSKLSVAAGVPCTTTLRWIDKLESESLIVRSADPLDARRVWVALSHVGVKTMRAYIEEISGAGLSI